MDTGRAREHALVEPVEQRHRLGAGRPGAAQLAAHRGHPGVGRQREQSIWSLPQQARAVDGGVRVLGGLGEPPAHLQRVRQADRHRDHELALPGRARDRDAAAEVPHRVVVALAEQLREAEVVRRVEPTRQSAVVQRVEPRRGVLAQRLGVTISPSPIAP